MIFKIAKLNILAHKKRTYAVVFAVSIAVFVLVFVGALLNSMVDKGFDNLLGGHIQINEKGYSNRLNDYTLDYLINNPDNIIKEIQKNPNVETVEKRTTFGAIMLYGESDHIEMLFNGVQKNTQQNQKVLDGIIDGRFVKNREEIVISKVISDLTGVVLGNDVKILVEDIDGIPYYLTFKVVGIYKTNDKTFDEMYGFMAHNDAQMLLNTANQSIEIRIDLKDFSKAIIYADQLQKKYPNLEVKDWKEIHGQMIMMLEMSKFAVYFINILIIIISVTVIINTIFMSIFERIKEFGTLRAMGIRNKIVRKIILVEGTLQGLIGSFIGTIVAIPIILLVKKFGIYIGEVGNEFGIGVKVYASFDIQSIILSLISGILIVVICSYFGAKKASKVPLVKTIL